MSFNNYLKMLSFTFLILFTQPMIAGEMTKGGCVTTASPKDIQSCIEKNGSKETLKEILKNNEFEKSFFQGIKSGNPQWLDLLPSLYPETDAAITTGLFISLGQSMDKNPEKTLQVISNLSRGDDKVRQDLVKNICSNHQDAWDDRDPTYKKIAPKLLSILAKRETKIKGIKNNEKISTVSSECISEIERAKAVWKKYVDENSKK